jgi:phosphoribosyl 1,2-cyclic phosphodiesterase
MDDSTSQSFRRAWTESSLEPSGPTDLAPAPDSVGAHLRILASGSSGNCSVLVNSGDSGRRAWLIDAGLSPRRTRLLLASCGLTLADIESVILTHLDADHFHSGWLGPRAALPPVRLHLRHEGLARRIGIPGVQAFGGAFNLGPCAVVDPILMNHDDLGVAALRFDFASGGRLGFATDLGRATSPFTRHMAGVDVLALESNYCPRLQLESDRPRFLKDRIMGGRGHLSNQQAAEAAAAIAPRLHLVLLHLSDQCNRPDLAAALHAGAPYALTISEQRHPSRWVPVPPRAGRPALRVAPATVRIPASLFSAFPA